MAKENEYILFLDETDTNTENEYFCLAGFIINRQDYEDALIPKVNELKTRVLKCPHIVFHYKDMRKQVGEFKCLDDATVRKDFWEGLCEIISNTDMTTVAAYINAVEYRKKYSKEDALSEYNVLFNEIVNSFVYFLIEHNGVGTIMLESRNAEQNRNTQNEYSVMTQFGTNIYQGKTISRMISTLNFNIKKDNSIGLQIADMIPLVLVRKLHKKSNPYSLYISFYSKLYKAGKSSVDGYGLINVRR